MGKNIVSGSLKAGAQSSSFILRSCPLCHEDSAAALIKVFSDPSAESLPFEQLKDYWRGFFNKRIFFSYYRCDKCGMLYCPEYFSSTQLSGLYQQMPDNTAGMPVDLLKKTQRGYFEFLKRHSSLNGDYLEVGPDAGFFTEYCVQEGNFGRYWLFEPNQSMLPVLTKMLAGNSCQIFPAFLEFDALPDGQISTAVMIHVLDHVLDPENMVSQLSKKLVPGGVALFVTHDESSLLARGARHRWPAYCLQHPHLFSASTLRRLLESAGYSVLEIEKTYNYFPLFYLIKHLCWVMGLKRMSIPDWNNPVFPLKLGNILMVARWRGV